MQRPDFGQLSRRSPRPYHFQPALLAWIRPARTCFGGVSSRPQRITVNLTLTLRLYQAFFLRFSQLSATLSFCKTVDFRKRSDGFSWPLYHVQI